MRVGFIATHPPIECGIGTYTSYLNEVLVRLGNETFVIAPFGAQGERVFPAYHPESEAMASQIFNITAELTPDVVHVQHEFGLYGPQRGVQVIELIVRYRLEDIPVVTTLHTVHPELKHQEETILRLIVSESSAIIVHENSQKKTLVKYYGQEDKIHVIPHGVRQVSNVKGAKRKLELEGKKVLLLCGYFRPSKGFMRIVKLMPEICMHSDDIVLVVAGKSRKIEFSEYKNEFYETINQSPVHDRIVVLRGQFPQHTFDTIISASDVVGLPYEAGAQSGIMAHCYAFHKPMVTSNLPAFRKSIKESKGGLICKTNKDYVKNIIRLLTDTDLRQEFEKNIKKFVEEHVSWERVVKTHIDVYHQVVSVPYGKAKYVYWGEEEENPSLYSSQHHSNK
jgi:glycosyltransferase involved in cell wall biosynthesis